MSEIPAAVTLYWQEERIKELEAELDDWKTRALIDERTLELRTTECYQLRALLSACQRALREMQAQRDAAREGKR